MTFAERFEAVRDAAPLVAAVALGAFGVAVLVAAEKGDPRGMASVALGMATTGGRYILRAAGMGGRP